MKTILALILTTLVCAGADFPLPSATQTLPLTLISSTITTTNAASTNYVEKCTHHTFQITGPVTNTASVTITLVLSRSVDGTTWIPFRTNNFEAVTAEDFTLEGKWAYFKSQLTATNAAVTVKYLGQ